MTIASNGAGMKIKEIHVYSHDLPVKNGPYTMGGVEVYALDTTVVKIVADNGLVGWGETCPVGRPTRRITPRARGRRLMRWGRVSLGLTCFKWSPFAAGWTIC